MPDANHLPAGTAADGPFALAITPQSAGWSASSLWVLELPPGGRVDLESGDDEIIVLPLSGAATVGCDGREIGLAGRRSVFDGPSDFGYVGRGRAFAVGSVDGGRFALCGARAATELPFRHVPAAAVPIELRGAGHCSRQVHNFAMADTFDADSILACEVITPAGNWSSYPSHKHDEETAHESALEEIYYFEFGETGARSVDLDRRGFGFHRVYGTQERPIDVLAEVRTGDAVLVPHGYHGPSVAAPGYDMYFLNVMSGTGTGRSWRIVDDPAHAWIRQTWRSQDMDPRLPLPRTTGV
ncbi:5-deoxy-glucuronate isomerase [Rhodococcus maanshanensis]|uniref:5-deoxy-glucuronate isomerase n=1 Tax=Rhodococcus maanshanensis TaxID=183556 RepID=A0A1H7XP73_9NOCA|nr:5-deoxy-glucuronate isomerase [Rhodococcus maanshanensis]SEM34789.1 5-deoxy-glucuronate isomerase [Rhodococcus maanshanensis]